MAKMTDKEITQFIEYYIGVERFRQYHGLPDRVALRGLPDRAALREFYYVDCDLEIEPSAEFKVADEFERILRGLSSQYQARILRAGLEEFYVYSGYEPGTTQEKLRPRLEELAERLESQSTLIETISPQSTSGTVRALLEEAANVIHRGRIPRAVDRIHTALHGHIRHVCDDSKISYGKSPKIKPLFAKLREEHPAFESSGPRAQDVDKTLDSLASIVDALGPIRNQASMSHPPEEDLFDETEASLVVNAVSTIFNYIEEKVEDFAELQRQSTNNHSAADIAYDKSPPATADDIPF